MAGLLVVGVLVLLVLAVGIGAGEYRLFRYYWPAQDALNVGVILLRAIGPMLWCLLFARASIRSAYHLVSCF